MSSEYLAEIHRIQSKKKKKKPTALDTNVMPHDTKTL